MSALVWTTKSTRNLAGALTAAGHRVSDRAVARMLRAMGFSLQANAKVVEVLAIRLPESLRNELEHSAKIQGATPSEMVRRAVVDSVSFYVLWEQTFDGDEWHWVRFDKALTPKQAEEMFQHFSRLAPTHGYRRVQIRHGRDEVVKEWTGSARGRH